MLRYQLNPHFLFNTLNAINARVRLGENLQAGEMIQYLSRFLRHSLDHGGEQTVTLAQELESLELYLDIEQARFGERLEVVFDVVQAARDALVPSLILQPIVENAMKYAVSCSETGGTVTISARLIEDMLELQVRDTGPGIADLDNAEGTGIGLKNTRERLAALYNDYQFTMHNCTPSGLLVTIRLPCNCDTADVSPQQLGQAV
jgi:LytS/YehU family sensor histidine kinase